MLRNKLIFLIALFTIFTGIVFGDINIQFAGTSEFYKLESFKVNNIDYVYLKDLNKVLQGQLREVLIDDRVYFTLYKTEISFCIESSFLHVSTAHSYIDDYYNFYYPLIYKEGKYSIPEHFVNEILPMIFSEQMQFQDGFLIVKEKNKEPIDVIVIDPGHGGKDPGALSSKGTKEKKITLEVAKKLKKRLEEELNIKVLLTRDDDSFVSLKDRTKFANDKKADLFVSLHCNAARNKKADGIEVYYLSEAKTDDSRAAQALENSVVAEYEGKDAEESYNSADLVISDLVQSAQLMESISLAYKSQTNLILETDTTDRGVKSANFYVLRGAFMPAVLIEMGFISNSKEAKKLVKSSYQDKIVESLFYAIKSFKVSFDRNNSLND